jgi:hypothetical protein
MSLDPLLLAGPRAAEPGKSISTKAAPAVLLALAVCGVLLALIAFVPSDAGLLRSWGVAGRLVLFCHHLL